MVKIKNIFLNFLLKNKKKGHLDFIIIGAMRSGSNLLQEKLNYIEDIICLGELYNPSFIGVDRPHANIYSFANYKRDDKESLKKRQEDPLQLLEDVIEVAHRKNKKIGFRIFDGHNTLILNILLNNRKVKKILLYRNLVDSFVSLEIARQSGKWVQKSDKNNEIKKIYFSIDSFEKYVKETNLFYSSCIEKIEKKNQEYVMISYEDVLNDKKIRELSKFLGTTNKIKEKDTKLRKQNPSNLEDKILNFTEVETYIKNFKNEKSAFN